MTIFGYIKKGYFVLIMLFIFLTPFYACQHKEISTASEYFIPPDQLKVLEIKADRGDINAASRVANYYKFVNYNLDKIIKYLKQIAVTGDTTAQYNLAFHLLLSTNAQETRNEGIIWLKKAADGGELYAQVYLAKLYEIGDVVEQNNKYAKQWYEKAAQQGDIQSMLKMSDFYLEGKGGEKDRIKAFAFLLFAELFTNNKSLQFKEIETKKKAIILSEAEKKKAIIEYGKFKKSLFR